MRTPIDSMKEYRLEQYEFLFKKKNWTERERDREREELHDC